VAKRKTGGYALAGGIVAGGAVLAAFLLTSTARIEAMAQEEAEKAAGAFLGRTYGLTPERIAKLQAYGTILG
jgi:hypothetical protein